MKSSPLTLLLAATSYASPLLSDRQSTCPTSSSISASRAVQIRSAFQQAGVIPDVVPSITPTIELTVKYGNINENLGNTFTVPRTFPSPITLIPTHRSFTETLQEPIFSFPPEANHNPATTKYTYIQVDPDAPGPALPLLRQFLHHIIYDVQPSCIPSQSPKTQASYMLLTPLSVAPHRYVSLLYRQPQGSYTPPPLSVVDSVARAPFDLQKYVREAGLVLVGGNFMREGLGSTVCALVPRCTVDGVGYNGPLDGSALNGVVEVIKGARGS
jgi:hypothetical protein